MESIEEDDGDLPAVEEFLDQLEDAEVDVVNLSQSMVDLVLDEEHEPTTGVQASTPVSGKSTAKHLLTPSSKNVEPLPKRQVSSSRIPVPVQHGSSSTESKKNGQSASTKIVNPSGATIKKRRKELTEKIKQIYEKDNSEKGVILQDDMLTELGLSQTDKKRLTNALKDIFPETRKVRREVDGQMKNAYISLKIKLPFELVREEKGAKQILYRKDTNIENMKRAIERLEEELKVVQDQIAQQFDSGVGLQINLVKLLFERQKMLTADINKYRDGLERLLENEIVRLAESSDPHVLQAYEKAKLVKEIETFANMLALGVRTDIDLKLDGMFLSLTTNLREQCPLLYHIVEHIFLTKSDGSVHEGIRVNSASHAIAILMSLRSQKITNDFKILFTFMCISFGAGMRFVNMLNHVGFTVSWKNAMDILDDRMLKMNDNVKRLTPRDIPIMLLMDNINIYRGRKRHLRLFKDMAPTMWNFTGRALAIPHITEEISNLLKKPEYMLQPQKDVLKLCPEDILYSKERDGGIVFEKAIDNYILSTMNSIYNEIPVLQKEFKEINDTEFNKWLSESDFSKPKKKFKIICQGNKSILKCDSRKTEIFVLPLSIEDNATIAGTSSILDNFALEYDLPSSTNNPELLLFDNLKHTFDIQLARSRYEYLNTRYNHQSYIADLETRLHDREKALDGITVSELEDNEDYDMEEDEHIVKDNVSCTLESEKRRFRKEDEDFWKLYNHLAVKVDNALHSNSNERFVAVVNEIAKTNAKEQRDHLKRSVLHVAVEKGNGPLAKCLIYSGFNVNLKEGCGITPLHLAVLANDFHLCEFLIDRNAKFDGPLFSGIPSPLKMATTLNLNTIEQLMIDRQQESDDENELITLIDQTLKQNKASTDSKAAATGVSVDEEVNRSSEGFITHLVGDVGTCKTNQAVMARSCSYSWVGIVVGDLHNKGYFTEACFKQHGKSGLHYIVMEVMKRKKLTTEAFKGKKFQENFLSQVREAVRDCCKAYCMAACVEFKKSRYFPSAHELVNCLHSTKSHSQILLTKFKSWVKDLSQTDTAFRHHASTFMYYGPLFELYNDCINYGDGAARETIYRLQIPIYAQLGFKNYYTETFRHTVNFAAKWPIVARKILQANCSVNLQGHTGKGIELDAFVESEVVKPLKLYCTGHTTVKMCERVMGNIDLFKKVRGACKSPDSFDVHHTSRHSEQSPFPDQLKGAWFCLRSGFFESKGRKHVPVLPVEGKGKFEGELSAMFVDAYDKGVAKIRENFTSKLYDCFPDLRFRILMEDINKTV